MTELDGIMWRRLRYMLSPQLDLYRAIAQKVIDQKVLEVGFGTGIGTLQLASRADYVLAIETDAQAIHFAKQTLPTDRVKWMEADITHLVSLPKFDSVVMVETLEHIADWQSALRRIFWALKPGGELYMTARNRNADLRRNDLHEREWSAGELVTHLQLFFSDVKLYDYTLTTELGTDTHITPLIAVATKEEPC